LRKLLRRTQLVFNRTTDQGKAKALLFLIYNFKVSTKMAPITRSWGKAETGKGVPAAPGNDNKDNNAGQPDEPTTEGGNNKTQMPIKEDNIQQEMPRVCFTQIAG
jgi:hypothetical protein